MIRILHTIALIVSISSFFNAHATTRVSAASGNWGTTSTWSPSGVPACGDSIIVLATHTISISNQQNYSAGTLPLRIIVYGEIMFYNGSKLSLPCNSYVIVYPGGIIDHDQGLASSNLINICGVAEWDSNSTLYGLACLPATNPVCSNALPVELLSFTGEACGLRKICLDWQTVTESNNDHYAIERSSDGLSFSVIGQVASKAPGGNSISLLQYAYMDVTATSVANYYRLKQIDHDGSATSSRIVAVSAAEDSALSFLIYPNYNPGDFSARVSGASNISEIAILLRDENGSIVYKSLYFNSGNENVEIFITPENKLLKGNYVCSFITGGEEHAVKMIVTP